VNIAKAITEAVEVLKKNSIASPFLEARMLLAKILSTDINSIILHHQNTILSPDEQKKFFDLVYNRSQKIPLAYLVNKREFFNNEFHVDNRVLDPRPDSESLIELIINNYPLNSELQICEIGCGSGCLIISLLKYFSKWQGCAIDISSDALEVAKINSKKLLVNHQITFLRSDIFNNLHHQKFDIIISNPPYIPTGEIDNLQDEVKLYEPRIALDGGCDGLKFYRQIALQAQNFLNVNGRIYLEIGYNQHLDIQKIFEQNNFKLKKFQRDLNGIIRALEFEII